VIGTCSGGRALGGCRPEHLIENYNQALRFVAARHPACLPAPGADNWLLRKQAGDQSYLDAFARLLKQA
jgi:hypothetical protein